MDRGVLKMFAKIKNVLVTEIDRIFTQDLRIELRIKKYTLLLMR